MAYFSTLRKEKNDKLNSIYGHEINLGSFSNLLGNLKEKKWYSAL